jgi:hypothetical protein
MRLLTLFLLLPLIGCGVIKQQKMQAVGLEVKNDLLKCRSDYEQRITKTCVAMAKCSNTAIDKIADAGYQFPDLLEYSKASRVSLCQKVDKGKMSYEDATLEMTKIGMDITNEEQRRISVNSTVSAYQTQSGAAVMGASAAMMQAAKPAPSNTVNCTTQQMGAMGTINCR